MKKLLAIAMLVFSTLAFADRASDLIAGDDGEYCQASAIWYNAGMRAADAGWKSREFREFTKDMEGLTELPKDAMFVPEWSTFTDDDKALLTTHVLAGFDDSKKYGKLEPEQISELSQAYFDGCMKHRSKKQRL